MSTKKKRLLFVLLDAFAIMLSFVFAIWLVSDVSLFSPDYTSKIKIDTIIAIIVFLFVHVFIGTYRTILATISVYDALKVITANLLAISLLLILYYLNALRFYSVKLIIVSFFITTLVMEGIRFSYRVMSIAKQKYLYNRRQGKKILIYGAGDAGRLLAKEFTQNSKYDYQIVGFIDDNYDYKNRRIDGLPILGNGAEIYQIIEKFSIDEVIIAMPSVSGATLRNVTNSVVEANAKAVTMMPTSAMLDATNLKKSLRKVEINDLLNRREIKFNNKEIEAVVSDKTILITGAGGSIGSGLVRKIAELSPRKLILLDVNETGLYQIEQELKILFRTGKIATVFEVVCLITTIRDLERLQSIFSTYKIDVVFHAAAHKHVPLMEISPEEAIKNNIFGTKNLIDVSIENKVKIFVNISTDKAVNPTNVMGASKRFIEMMLQSERCIKSKTKFVAVRFGNVLGSNGSVIPLFKKQIDEGGPVTVTHPDIVRYFMTIPEAVSLVLQATVYARGGEIFVLDMGEPVKIKDLAENMIRLSGFSVGKDIAIEYVGLRPGEKLYEELLMAEEGLEKTPNELILIAQPTQWTDKFINESLDLFMQSINSKDKTVQALEKVVTTYIRTGDVI